MAYNAAERLEFYLKAEKALLEGGQSARIDTPGGGREVRLGDLAEIRREIEQLRRQVAQENRKMTGPRHCTPYFGDPSC